MSTTDVHPWQVAGDANAATAIGLRVPMRELLPPTGLGHRHSVLGDQHGRSWATLHVTAGPPYEVRQGGPRKLWDETETAYRSWLDAGQPAVEAWRFTVTPSGQQVELS